MGRTSRVQHWPCNTGADGVRVWRVEDGSKVATIEAGMVRCLAVSRDGNWIAAGTRSSGLFVWDAKTHETVWQHSWGISTVLGVDFSPDSTRLVVGRYDTATVFDVGTWIARELDHQDWVTAAKYSPKGDRIATATRESIRVWDSSDGRLLIHIDEGLSPLFNTGLLWFDNHLFVVSNNKMKRFDASTGSAVAQWQVPLPVVYGEGDKALGRLLSQILTSSGDTSILAWTGKSGSFNSCLPDSITVFRESSTTHIPVNDSQLNSTISTLKPSSLELTLMTRFYDRLVDLYIPSVAGRRMKLPCLRFKLEPLSSLRRGSEWVFRAKAIALRAVEIRTNENLSQLDSLYLVHPWIDFLLDRQPVGNIMETIPEESGDTDLEPSSVEELQPSPEPFDAITESREPSASWFARPFNIPFVLGSTSSLLDTASSLIAPSTVTPADKHVQALQAIARLKQPFGALLLTPRGRAAYRRVATGNLITVQVVEQITPTIMNQLIDSVRVLDVL